MIFQEKHIVRKYGVPYQYVNQGLYGFDPLMKIVALNMLIQMSVIRFFLDLILFKIFDIIDFRLRNTPSVPTLPFGLWEG